MISSVWVFIWSAVVRAAVKDEVEKVEVTEGDTVTLSTDLTEIKSDDVIRWTFGATDARIAQLLSGNTFTDYDERFKNRLQLDPQTGSLTISNMSTSDSGPYKVLISSEQVTNKHFNVTVYGLSIVSFCGSAELVARLMLSAVVALVTVSILFYHFRARTV